MQKYRKNAYLIILIIVIFIALSFYRLPEAEAIVWVSGHLTSNTTWAPGDTYRLFGDTYVDPAVKLTILPGTEVQIADGFSLVIDGILNASGTELQPIIFTSSLSTPASGAWNTIKFEGNDSGQFLLSNVKIRYATNGITVQSLASATIQDSEITNCSSTGILVVGKSNVLISRNLIGNNTNGISTDTSDTHSGITIEGNTISNNKQNGILLTSYKGSSGNGNISGISILSNIVESNTQTGISLSASGYYANVFSVNLTSNIISSNGGGGISVSSVGSDYAGAISDVNILSNSVTSNVGTGISLSSSGGYPPYTYYPGTIFCTNLSSNTVSLNTGTGISLYSYGASAGYIHNTTFLENTIQYNGGVGISLSSNGYGDAYVANITFLTNSVSFNQGNGISVSSGGTTGYIYRITAANNTVSNNGGIGVAFSNGVNYGYIYIISFRFNTISSNNGTGVSLSSYGYYRSAIYSVTIYWNQVSLNGETGVYLKSTDGGNSIYSPTANIYDVYLTLNTFSSNMVDGLHVQASDHNSALSYDISISNNSFTMNSQKGLWVDGGINANIGANSISFNQYGALFSSSQNNTMNNCDIFGNTYGANVTSGATLNATNNYWGSVSGPYHFSINPTGTGNPVNGNGVNLLFVPFLTSNVSPIVPEPPINLLLVILLSSFALMAALFSKKHGSRVMIFHQSL